MPICPSDKILNPKTNRCVSKNGAIGTKILKEQGTVRALLDKLWETVALLPDTQILLTMKNGEEYVIRRKKIAKFDKDGKKLSKTEIKTMRWETHLSYDQIENVAIANDKLNKQECYALLYKSS